MASGPALPLPRRSRHKRAVDLVPWSANVKGQAHWHPNDPAEADLARRRFGPSVRDSEGYLRCDDVGLP